MPRSARLDAPGLVHHVMVRGIERRDIFIDDKDRYAFLERLSKLAGGEKNQLYAFVLVPNHIHLLMRTLELPLSTCMRRLLTSYALYFNRRHKRCGHLFQNRYKSFVVDEDLYLMELIRYIHLNPVRAGLCENLDNLSKWPFSGYAALMGNIILPWFEVAHTISLFGNTHTRARARLEQFMREGLIKGRRDDLLGGGLRRSLAAIPSVECTRMLSYDERILGCGSFVEAVLVALEQKGPCVSDEVLLGEFLQKVALHFGVSLSEMCSGTKRRTAVKARSAAVWIGVTRYGFSATELSQALSISRTRVYEILNSGRGEKAGRDILL